MTVATSGTARPRGRAAPARETAATSLGGQSWLVVVDGWRSWRDLECGRKGLVAPNSGLPSHNAVMRVKPSDLVLMYLTRRTGRDWQHSSICATARVGSPPSAVGSELFRAKLSPAELLPRPVGLSEIKAMRGLSDTAKNRTKTMRAYDNEPGAFGLSEGWQVHYNLVRNHLALATTPGLAAGMPNLGTFRWRTLLDLATVSRNITPAPGVAEPDD